MTEFKVEFIEIDKLKQHPRNYREHPDDQLQHLIKSIEEHGIYKNIVVAEDYTILAGHGIVKALSKLNYTSIPVIRLPITANDTKALKILIGDNEAPKLSLNNDIELSEILKELKDIDVKELLGTGFDEMMLANLVLVTRPESEIKDFNEAAEWVGLPDFKEPEATTAVVVNFKTDEDRREFFDLIENPYTEKKRSIWFPYRENEDTKSVKYE